jgi:hypothetical protein
MIFNKDEARVEFTLNRSGPDQNKQMFDALLAQQDDITSRFGKPLIWRRLDDKKVSIVQFGAPFEGHNKTSWNAMTAWLVAHIQRLEGAFSPCIPVLREIARTPALSTTAQG